MDAGQIFGCFIVGGIFMIATELLDESHQEGKVTSKTRFIFRYLTFTPS